MRSSDSFQSRHRWSRGSSGSDAVVFLFVVCLLIALVYGLLHLKACATQPPPGNPVATTATAGTTSTQTTQTTPMEQDSGVHYLCQTSEHNVPVKAVIAARDGAQVFERPEKTAGTAQHLPTFSTWFVFDERFVPDEQQGYILIGPSSTSTDTKGWIQKTDMIRWMTREAVQPIPEKLETKPLLLWEKEEDIGNAEKWSMQARNPQQVPHYPILEAKDGRYKLAVTFLKTDATDYGVAVGWTDQVHEGEDVRFFYLQTKEELADIIEKTRVSLLDLGGGDHSDQPLVRFLRERARLTVGSKGLDTKNDNFGFWMRTLEELRVPLSSMRPQPADIQAKSAVYKDRLDRMLGFYQDAANWDERGEGWLPKEIAPVD